MPHQIPDSFVNLKVVYEQNLLPNYISQIIDRGFVPKYNLPGTESWQNASEICFNDDFGLESTSTVIEKQKHKFTHNLCLQ